jgi:hypothetical protein
MGFPRVLEKVLDRSFQRSGQVAEGTELSSKARQITCSFPPSMFCLLQNAAEKNDVSVSEIIRQCVQRSFE